MSVFLISNKNYIVSPNVSSEKLNEEFNFSIFQIDGRTYILYVRTNTNLHAPHIIYSNTPLVRADYSQPIVITYFRFAYAKLLYHPVSISFRVELRSSD